MKIAFTGGGTAGHIFPGIAVAEALKKEHKDLQLFWIGSKRNNEKLLIEEHKIDFFSIPTGKLRRYFSLQNILDMFKVIAGIFKSFYLLLKLKPDLLFSKGGYVAVPPCIAAKILRIPIIIHESDFSPGLTTRLSATFATTICVSYTQTIEMFSNKLKTKCIYTGNPVRESFYTASRERGKKFLAFNSNDKKILLVIGGSLGAAQINDLIEETIIDVCKNFFVVHQLGSANFSKARSIKAKLEAYDKSLVENYKPFEFIGNEMPDVLAASDLVVSRAGANSLWEIVSQSKPCVLIPLSAASSRGDQIENASFFREAGCAEVLIDDEVNAKNFLASIDKIFSDDKNLCAIKEASKKVLPEPASKKIAKIISHYEAVQCSAF